MLLANQLKPESLSLTRNWKIKTQPTNEAPIQRFWTLNQQTFNFTLKPNLPRKPRFKGFKP
jgi:hypothetical protein